MAAQIQQALIAHDRVRLTTDIPLFYGRKGKDTISPQQLVERLEKAACVAGWNALANPGQRKTDEFFLSLRDNALSWYNTLDNIISFNKEDWDELKKKFLEAYAPKYSAKALCICFQDLRQKSDKSVQDFYNKVSDTFRNAYQTKPDHTVTFVGTLLGTATQAEYDVVLKQGVERMQLLMLNTVFLGGLREEIRNRVLEDGPTNPDESVKAAREIESIINDRRKEKGFHVTTIEGPPEDEEAEDVGEVDEQEAAQLREVNAILRKKGRPQYRFRVRPQRGQQRGSYGTGANGSFNRTGAIVCFFCNKPGHRIAQCRDNPATKRGRGRGRRRVAAIEEVANRQDSNNSLNY
jgi:hypothetical protein